MEWLLALFTIVLSAFVSIWMYRLLTRAQRDCWHHDRITAGTPLTPPRGESWISGILIDLGRRKMFWCRVCKQRWFV